MVPIFLNHLILSYSIPKKDVKSSRLAREIRHNFITRVTKNWSDFFYIFLYQFQKIK